MTAPGGSVFALALALSAVLATPAGAQSLTRQELEAALLQRDQEIAALERRIAALEAARPAPSAPAAQTPPPNVRDAASVPSARDPATPATDETALQALSRGLVARGALVLPRGSLEIAPSLAYAHTQKQGLVLVDTPEGVSTVSDQRLRDDSLQSEITTRVGLPWRSQLELRIPFDWKREVSALGDGSVIAHDATHLGDVQVELSHQFLSEHGWRPDLIGAVAWRFPTGLDPYHAAVAAVADSSGTNEFTGRLTALKTIDPLVLFTTLTYATSLSRRETFGRVRPGDAFGIETGALLAVSPETSLSFGLAQQFTGHTRVDGAPIAGSDGVAAVAQFGLDQTISSRVLLDVSLGVGLTRDAPDYVFMVSVPIRFR